MASIYTINNYTNSDEIKNLDKNLIPKILYTAVINRNNKNVLKILVNNPNLCNKLMIFYQHLKLSYSLYSENRCCCNTKIDWETQNFNKKYIRFIVSIALQRYIINYQNVSNLFYLNVQLGNFLQTIKLFKSYESNNRYFCKYEWLKYINYNKFSYLVPYKINFNLYNTLTCNNTYSLKAQNFLRYYILLFKI